MTIVRLTFIAVLLAVAAPALAQQQSPPIGSPAAARPIDGKQLPAPQPKFGGVIKDDALKSKP